RMEQFIKQIIQEAGTLAKQYFDQGVSHTTKTNRGDLLTAADIAVSDYLVAAIQASYPDHAIYTEELADPINKGADYEWVIDPIDGTRNFAFGIPMWCVLVGLQYKQETILAAVHNPIANELFFAKKGGGAFLNDKPIHVNDNQTLDYGYGTVMRAAEENKVYGSHMKEMERAYTHIVQNTNMWLNNFACMMPVCYFASGGVDMVLCNSGLDHDYVAPLLIAEEAGAVVTDFDGNPWQRGRKDIVIANTYIHPMVMEWIRK
nr:hypothetical protein [Candidatus Magasanikbacteria bacterium]